MEPQEKSKRPLYLPPLSLSPYLQQKRKLGKRNREGQETATAKGNRSLPANTSGAKSFTAPTSDPKEKRRNGICVMSMPAEYFSALPHLELLNVRYEFGLEKLATDQGAYMKDEEYSLNPNA
ncbi:hypothetical protein OS493_007511 [Desmophyllum pertusum]|uniref:Uncharacterized protein n=1 Tax=Desmophyllum pertusum TaxID=174260 RepID=A0A9W9Z3J5_9CNID|nr:hypothetical protein OS493_007511 [Desmophyllum pertusum]